MERQRYLEDLGLLHILHHKLFQLILLPYRRYQHRSLSPLHKHFHYILFHILLVHQRCILLDTLFLLVHIMHHRHSHRSYHLLNILDQIQRYINSFQLVVQVMVVDLDLHITLHYIMLRKNNHISENLQT